MIISERENHGFPQLLHDFSMVYQRVYGVCSQVEGIFGMASFAKDPHKTKDGIFWIYSKLIDGHGHIGVPAPSI